MKDQLVDCEEAIQELENSGVEVDEMNEEGLKIMTELRDGGYNVEKMEKDLDAVNTKYQEIKLQATRKEEVLQHVSVEWEKLDEGKMELENWLKEVYEHVNSVGEENEDLPEVIQVCFLDRSKS